MRKLFYTTAIPLLISSAVAMNTELDDARSQTGSEQIVADDAQLPEDSLLTKSTSLVERMLADSIGSDEYLNPAFFGCEIRHIYDENSSKNFTNALGNPNYKKRKKSQTKIRQKNRDTKHAITHGIEQTPGLWDLNEHDEESYGSAYLTIRDETITSLRDFALSNESGRGSTYGWTDEENATYIQDCFEMLLKIKDEYGYLPSVAQILLGDILPIVNYEQENELLGLLDNKPVSFSDEDVAALLSGVGSTPLDVISIENIENNCSINDPFSLYASLLRPFMQYSITSYLESEQDDLTQIMEFMDRDCKSIEPEKRQDITQTLNIMAIFESGLAEQYATTTDHEELIHQLRDEITNGERSTEDVANYLFQQWDAVGVREKEIAICVETLKDAGIQSYTWTEEDDLDGTYSEDSFDDSEENVSTEGLEHDGYTPVPSNDELSDENESNDSSYSEAEHVGEI